MMKLLYAIFFVATMLLTDTAQRPVAASGNVKVISKRAVNFTTSGMVRLKGMSAPGYHYSVAAASNLNDQVVLLVREGNRGGDGTYILLRPLVLPSIVSPSKELFAATASLKKMSRN